MEVINNPDNPCPPEIVRRQVSLEVPYVNFSGEPARGIIEVHEDAAEDVLAFFACARRLRFPIHRIARASDPEFNWKDDRLMAANATSGFNFRNVAGTDVVSRHGFGKAFDVNPLQNPYIRYPHGADAQPAVSPPGAFWKPAASGTLHARHPLVRLMQGRGWEWGGNWTRRSGRIDYQHFEKS